jgi:hypothetical protein
MSTEDKLKLAIDLLLRLQGKMHWQDNRFSLDYFLVTREHPLYARPEYIGD